VPATAMGRMLDQDEAAQLIRRLEARDPETGGRGVGQEGGEAQAGLTGAAMPTINSPRGGVVRKKG
jgi:hypothetical protein